MKIYEDHSNFNADGNKFAVKNWEHPEFWETMLPHDSIPRLGFGQTLPVSVCQDALIMDLTLTEGGLWTCLDDEEVLGYFDIVRRLSGSRGVIRCLEVPGDDVNRLARLIEKNYQFPEIVVRLNRETKFDKIPVTQIAADFGGSDFYLHGAYHVSREDEFKAIQKFVTRCFDSQKVPMVRLLDASRGTSDHYLLGIAVKLKKMADEADLPVRLRLVDSLGLFHPHPAASLPRGLPRLLHYLVDEVGYPGEWICVEPANDSAQAVSLIQATWLYGASVVGVSLGGRGARAGLGSLEGALASLLAIRADAPKVNLTLVRSLENLVTASGGVDKLPSQMPYLGDAVFQPRSSEVANADVLANACDPALVWGVTPQRTLSCHSSRHDVVEWLREHLGQGVILSPEHPGVVKMTEWIVASGRQTLTEKELLRQSRRYLPGFL